MIYIASNHMGCWYNSHPFKYIPSLDDFETSYNAVGFEEDSLPEGFFEHYKDWELINNKLVLRDKTEETAETVRIKRDALLKEADVRVTRYNEQIAIGISPVDDIKALHIYKQALRDVPQQKGFPFDVVWPQEV